MSVILASAIHWFCNLLILVICVRAVLTWVVTGYEHALYKIYAFTVKLTDPLMAPIAKLMAGVTRNSGIDWTPLVLIIIIQLLDNLSRTIILSM